jgi:hypothetical protein
MRRARLSIAAVLALFTAGGCATPEPYDYRAYVDHMPRSILVLPPTNETVEPLASYNFLSTATAPLAERGYYVYPVAIVDQMMKENGLPMPAEMHAAPLSKLREVIGADAVLYLHISEWGTSYQVIQSATHIGVSGKLVDARTGAVLWTGSHIAVDSSAQGQSNVIGMLVSAVIDQVIHTQTDHAHDIAGPATRQWLWADNHGLLLGPRHPGHAKEMERVRKQQPRE